MNNPNLAYDYRLRAKGRRKAIESLYQDGLYADTVRECQEACELALKSMIREAGHSVPLTHEVSAKLSEIVSDLPKNVRDNIEKICTISKSLRRDREIAFYGSEDITPSEFYVQSDAQTAISQLDFVLGLLPEN